MNFQAASPFLDSATSSPMRINRRLCQSERSAPWNPPRDESSSRSMSELPSERRRSKAIPILSSSGPLHRTPSEVQLSENEALADYRDYCMYARLVNGMSNVTNVVRTRHTPILEEPDFYVNDDTDAWRREQAQLRSKSPVSTVGMLDATATATSTKMQSRASWPVHQPPPFSGLPYQPTSRGEENHCNDESEDIEEDIFVLDL